MDEYDPIEFSAPGDHGDVSENSPTHRQESLVLRTLEYIQVRLSGQEFTQELDFYHLSIAAASSVNKGHLYRPLDYHMASKILYRLITRTNES